MHAAADSPRFLVRRVVAIRAEKCVTMHECGKLSACIRRSQDRFRPRVMIFPEGEKRHSDYRSLVQKQRRKPPGVHYVSHREKQPAMAGSL
ncbi:hypothetical protein KL938_004654 [Ogataea parapolymorpha]|nr:hypothetical protein KL938_004654 [Ogataea parapolymorpha]